MMNNLKGMQFSIQLHECNDISCFIMAFQLSIVVYPYQNISHGLAAACHGGSIDLLINW